jgi:hypothetical protein
MCRIGIASGEVTAGPAGTTTKTNYTVLGDVVNLASRMESLIRPIGRTRRRIDPMPVDQQRGGALDVEGPRSSPETRAP